MRVSTSTNIYCVRPDGPPAELTEAITRCGQAGYRSIDVSFQDAVRFDLGFTGPDWQAWTDDLGQTAAEAGTELAQAHAPFYNHCDPSASDQERADQLMRRSIEAAGRLGIPWMVVHAGTAYDSPTPHRDSLTRNITHFAPLIDMAAEHGVGIAFENLWEIPVAPRRRFTSEPEEVLELASSFDTENVGICWDFGHASYQQQDQTAGLALVAPWLRAIHVSDHLGPDGDHLLPYTGVIDWTAAMRALADTGYRGDLTFEMHKYTAALPDPLVHSALVHSHAVGEYLIQLAAARPGTGSHNLTDTGAGV